jgi:hypothetical protein
LRTTRSTLLLVLLSVALGSCAATKPVADPAKKVALPAKYYSNEIRRTLMGKTRAEVETVLGKPDSESGFNGGAGSLFFKTFESKRNWEITDPETNDPCRIVIVRFAQGVASEVEFRCW